VKNKVLVVDDDESNRYMSTKITGDR